MPNVKAIVEYDGTDFCGFQIQPSVRTVQGELERTLKRLFQIDDINLVGAGRTDTGVHATGQVVNFEAPDDFPVERVLPALNDRLPGDIRVKEALEVPESFHARYSAKARTYIYVVLNRQIPSALLGRYTWHITQQLDLDSMRTAAAQLIGTHDFSSFGFPQLKGGSAIREVSKIRIVKKKNAVFVTIRANAFLRGMARAMVGTLVEIGQGKRNPEGIAEVMSARDRQAVRVIAPPQGLYLTRVEY